MSTIKQILDKHNGELGITWEDPDVVTPDTIAAIEQVIERERVEARKEEASRVSDAIGGGASLNSLKKLNKKRLSRLKEGKE